MTCKRTPESGVQIIEAFCKFETGFRREKFSQNRLDRGEEKRMRNPIKRKDPKRGEPLWPEVIVSRQVGQADNCDYQSMGGGLGAGAVRRIRTSIG